MSSRRDTMEELMPQACERCWARKQKCDRVKPACGQCASVSAECIERRQGSVLNPADPEAHHSYIESLKRRVANLESRLKSSPATSSAQSRPRTQTATTPGSTSRQRPEAPQRDSLQAEMGYLSLSAMADLAGEPIPTNPAVSLPTLVQATTSVSGCTPFQADIPNEALIGSLGDYHRGLLRQGNNFATADKMGPVPKFLAAINCSVPFMSSEQLWEEYTSISQQQNQGIMDGVTSHSLCKVIRIYMAMATGLLLGNEYRYMESVGTALAMTAVQLTPRAFAEASDLEVAQCLTSMIIFSLFSPYGGSSWHLLGLAITRCISAGMHTARVSARTSEDMDKENNSRLFWSLYSLDAVMSTALGRPLCLQDQDISAPIPFKLNDPEDAYAEFRAWNIQHASLLHDVRRNPGKGILFHWSNYKHWKETVPLSPQKMKPEELQWLREHQYPRAACRGLLAILHIPSSSHDMGEMSMIVEQAIFILEAYFEALDKQSRNQSCVFASLDGVEVFAAAICLVYATVVRSMGRGGLSQIQSSPQILIATQRPVQLLAHISGRFKMARDFGDVLQRFAAACVGPGLDGVVASTLQGISEESMVQIPPTTKILMERISELRKRL